MKGSKREKGEGKEVEKKSLSSIGYKPITIELQQ